MAEINSISIADLLIDVLNPRLPQPNVGQRDAMRAIAGHQNKKLLALVRHIVANGVNPADLSIVMPFQDDLRRHVVLEGNRRLTALRALENPEFLEGAVTADVLKGIRSLSKQYQHAPIESISCVVVADREEARPWIELRHTGENEGAGIVKWGSEDATRFRNRTGELEIHSQALSFLEGRGELTPSTRRDVPATSFRRLLATPEVRAKLGVELRQGRLCALADEAKVAKAMMHVVDELVSGRTKTGDIYTREQRVQYANKLPTSVVVAPIVQPGQGTALGSGAPTGRGKGKTRAAAGSARLRNKLIPHDCALNVTDARCRYIEAELRRLSLQDFVNGVSVLFRVFIELSVDDYIDRVPLAIAEPEPSLATKMREVLSDLLGVKKLNATQAVPVRRALQKDSFLLPSVKMLHQYVHSKHVFPAPSDLRAHWDSLQPFVVAMWTR